MPTFSDRVAIPYTPEQLFDLVADVGKYPEFLPWCVGARVRSSTQTELHADLTIGFGPFRESFTSRVSLERPTLIRVSYENGPFRYLNNQWTFTAVDSGTQVHFWVDFEFRNRLLQKAIGVVFGEAVKRMVSAFIKRARDTYGPPRQSPSPPKARLARTCKRPRCGPDPKEYDHATWYADRGVDLTSTLAACAQPGPDGPPPGYGQSGAPPAGYGQGAPPAYAQQGWAGGMQSAPPQGPGQGPGPGAESGAMPQSQPHEASGEERGGMAAKFRRANVSGDGRLTQQQAQAGGMGGVAKHFAQIDRDQKGYVTLEDVRSWHQAKHERKMEKRSAQGQTAAAPPPPSGQQY